MVWKLNQTVAEHSLQKSLITKVCSGIFTPVELQAGQ